MMSKTSDRRKAQDNTNQESAQLAAPVAATEAASSAPAEDGEETPPEADTTTDQAEGAIETSTDESTGDQQTASAEQTEETTPAPAVETTESVKGDISVAGSKKPKPEKVPSFVPNQAERTRLQGLSNDELRTEAGDRVASVGANDFRVFQIDDSFGLADQIVGSPLERSGIRSGVIDFLRSRTGDNGVATKDSTFENAAVGWAIASYMVLAMAGGVVKGKFDQGYLAARGNDVRRGMVARRQLKIVADLTPAPVAPETKAEEAPAPAAE